MTVDIVVCMENSLLVKAGNEMAGVLLELDTTLRFGIPIGEELAPRVFEMIDVALAKWQEATAPPDEA